ncbi:MAG TPA: peptide-methionine (R)-S-oxide reductase, partial [Nitrospiria bacterium]|nr:peptide-methionine (R)-S-oxide reductase [Nitrospiria bacterium]
MTRKGFGKSDVMPEKIEKVHKTEDEWRKMLTPEQFYVLREEGTERPFTSFLLEEKRKGQFVCAGCELPLFTSEMKFDSGTGWPSF